MNNTVTTNFAKLKYHVFIVPIILLLAIFSVLYINDALQGNTYSNFQKDWFISLNTQLAQYPLALENLTELGDGLIILSFFTALLIYAPKFWESLITGFIISAVFTVVLKRLFSIKRPAATYLEDHFTIIGDKLTGHNSFPSGHSITVFTVLTILLFAFMPSLFRHRVMWTFCICTIGIVLISTRIGVGAHYPIDVTVGAIIGYISGILGIIINEKYSLWGWISNRKYYPFFIALFAVSSIIIITKILAINLVIFYLALFSLLISLYLIINLYVKKNV